MNRAEGLFLWSFPLGNWFNATIRVSVFTPLLAVLLIYNLGVRAGIIATVLALASLLAHEFAHLFAARSTGGYGNEILISPFGGLAIVHPGSTFLSRILVPASGPILNIAVCIGLAPVLLSQEMSLGLLMNPLKYKTELSLYGLPGSTLTCSLAFIINWLLVIINVIPVHPLDGGRILQAVLTERYGRQTSNDVYLRAGTICGILIVFAGLMLSSAAVVFIGAMILLMNMEETYRMRTADAYDDSFMGYDFSQGYTSLERDEDPDERRARQQGWFSKWKQNRREKREARELERAEADAQQLDGILARLSEVGFDALSENEKRVLKRASSRFRNRDDGGGE